MDLREGDLPAAAPEVDREAVLVDAPVGAREAGSCLDAGCVPFAWSTSRSSTTRTSTRFAGLFLIAQKSSPVAAPVSAPSISGPFAWQFSAPVTSLSFHSWPITPFPVPAAEPVSPALRPGKARTVAAVNGCLREWRNLCHLSLVPGVSYGSCKA